MDEKSVCFNWLKVKEYMDKSKKVSIIIPVFNSGETLERCLDSVLGIEKSEVEIIIINDGSTDKSLSICQRYAQNDGRVRIVSQENSGVSVARNVGIKLAEGEWICFVDSDDEIVPAIYNSIIEKLEKSMELVIWKCRQVTSFNGDVYEEEKNTIRNLNKADIEIIRDGLIEHDKAEYQSYKSYSLEFTTPWVKLYRKDIIDKSGIRFRIDLKIGEDIIFNYQYLEIIKKITLIDLVGYLYYQNNNSALHIYSENRYKEYLKLVDAFRELAPCKEKEIAQLGIRQYLYSLKIEFCHINNKKGYIERKKQALKLRNSENIERYFMQGNIFALKKEAALLAFFAKHRLFFVCDVMLKIKELMNIRVK